MICHSFSFFPEIYSPASGNIHQSVGHVNCVDHGLVSVTMCCTVFSSLPSKIRLFHKHFDSGFADTDRSVTCHTTLIHLLLRHYVLII